MPREGCPVVMATRADGPGGEFEQVLRQRGIGVEWVRTIAVAPPEDAPALESAIARAASFDWVAFTSAHAADMVLAHPAWRDAITAACDGRPRLAAVGPATAAKLAEHGHAPDLVASDEGGSGLAESLIAAHAGSLRGVKILWPCSAIAHREFPDRVASAGAALTTVVAYLTVPVPLARPDEMMRDLTDGTIDAVAFFSPSAALALAVAAGGGSLAPLAGRTIVASLGPSTTSTLLSLGAPPDIEARPHTARALASSLADRLAS
jgi:uroporphyrinogen-III synthase